MNLPVYYRALRVMELTVALTLAISISVVLAMVLAGCVYSTPKMIQHRATVQAIAASKEAAIWCSEFSYQPGTSAWNQCVLRFERTTTWKEATP